LQEGEPDKLLFGPIGKIAGRHASATIDSFFVRDLGGADTTALNLKWQMKHALTERMSVGVEGYGQIKDIADPGAFNDQEHRVGPVVYFKFGPWLQQEAKHTGGVGEEDVMGFSFGALFGVTQATSDVALKFNLSAVF
jgi:hypothetical protein